MADYYPLLSRAVSGLPVSNPETRRAIYDRASKALLGQLKAIQPPIPAADIEREENALKDAISRLEAELAPPADVAAMDAIEKALRELSAPADPPPPPPAAPAAKSPAAVVAPGAPAAAPKAPAAPAAPRPSESADESAIRPAGPVVTPAAPRPRASGRIGAPPAGSAGRNRTFMAAGLAAALIVIGGGVGYFAWKTRVKPSELRQPRVAQSTQTAPTAAEPSARPAAQEPAAPSQPKVESRASNRVLPEGQGEPAPAQQSGAPAAPPASAPAQTASSEPSRQAAPSQEAAVPVAQRSAILIAAPTQDNPQNVQTFVGNVVWRADTINRGPGQPPSHAVRADIDIPDAKFSAVMTIEKNTDSTLPASHTVTWRFQRGEDSPIPEIAETDTLQMRDDSSPQVDPMAGARARITSNIFIIALASGELLAKRNIDLLEKKGWFDLPLRASDGRLAKITVEKGAPGDRVIKEALARWEQ